STLIVFTAHMVYKTDSSTFFMSSVLPLDSLLLQLPIQRSLTDSHQPGRLQPIPVELLDRVQYGLLFQLLDWNNLGRTVSSYYEVMVSMNIAGYVCLLIYGFGGESEGVFQIIFQL